MTLESLNSWSTSLTDLGLAIVWQFTLLAGLVAVVCLLLRRSSPAIRYWCWQILALKLLLMPLWTLAIPLPHFLDSGPATSASSLLPVAIESPKASDNFPGSKTNGAQAQETKPPALPAADTSSFNFLRQVTWRTWLVLVWLGGICWQMGRLMMQRRRLGRLLSRAAPVTEPLLLVLANEAAEKLGLRRPPRVVCTDIEGSPFVCGLFRPVLVVPRGLLAGLDNDQWRQVLLHELAHLKRRDLWWGWIPEIARMIYFFHPVLHWVCYKIRLERELACDQLAMALSGRGAADYALVLVDVVSHASLPPALTAAAANS